MAYGSHYLRMVIIEHGHLELDGSEKLSELREAVTNLRRDHPYSECHRRELGTSIDALVPDISVLAKPSGKKRNVKTADVSTESL